MGFPIFASFINLQAFVLSLEHQAPYILSSAFQLRLCRHFGKLQLPGYSNQALLSTYEATPNKQGRWGVVEPDEFGVMASTRTTRSYETLLPNSTVRGLSMIEQIGQHHVALFFLRAWKHRVHRMTHPLITSEFHPSLI